MRGPSITWMLIYCCRRANLLPLAVVKSTTPASSPIPPLSAMRWSPHIPWFNTPLATDSSLFGTALETQYVSLTSIPAICAFRFWVERYTWRLYEMEQSWHTVPSTLGGLVFRPCYELGLQGMGNGSGQWATFLSVSRAQEHSIRATIAEW